MKIFKRIWWVLALVLVGSLFILAPKKALAASPDYLGSCAQAANENATDSSVIAGDNCQLINPNDSTYKNDQNFFTYGLVERIQFQNGGVIYQASNNKNADGSPAAINLLNSDKTALTVSPVNEQGALDELGYAGKGTVGSLTYYIYRSADAKVALLAKLNTDGTTHVLTMVNEANQYSKNSSNWEEAWTINKDAIETTSTGAACDQSQDQSCIPSPQTTTTADACEQNSSGSALTWILCPVLDAASGLSTTLINTFEGQLSFTVDQLGSTSDANSGTSKIQTTWSLIRDISSAALVIIMLVMVLSQALSFGPFDAYTVRKLLPKLVASVILMQLSWSLLVIVVGIFNDFGNGLADLMYYPFGGSANMDIWHLLANAKLSNGLLTSVDWGGLIGLGALGVAFPFTLLGAALVAVLALAAGLATLIFRKILIIAFLIFSPLALLAWILPGTKSYFDFWQKNLIKALMMFPLVVAIIATGRIFAYVVGTQDNTQFLNLIFILVGFFGPLFILPKTFKWGGSIMTSVGNGITKASSKVSEQPKKFLNTRQEGWSHERQRQSQERVSHGEGLKITRPWRLPLDKFRSGQWDPTLTGRRAEEAKTAYIAKGTESEEADTKAAEAKFKPAFSEAGDHDQLARDIAAGGDVSYTTKNGEVRKLGHMSLADRQAGLNAVLRYGGGGNVRFLDKALDDLNNGSAEERVMAEKFRDANAQALLGKMKHAYFIQPRKSGETTQQTRDTAFDRSIDNGIAESSFVSMDPVEVESMLESLSYRAAAGDTGAAGRLSTVLTTYGSAIQNDNIRPNISVGTNKVIQAFVEGGENLKDINDGRKNLGLPGIDIKAAANPAVAPAVRSLTGRIAPSGRIQQVAGTEPASTGDSGVINLHPGETLSPGGVVLPQTNGPRADREDDVPPSPPASS